jgi:hypothetical protein
MKTSNLLLLLAGAGLLYWYYNKNKQAIDLAAQRLILNQTSPLGLPPVSNKPTPDYTVQVGKIKIRNTPHTI